MSQKNISKQSTSYVNVGVQVPLALEQGFETWLLCQQGAICCFNENIVLNQSNFKYLGGEKVFKSEDAHVCYVLVAKVFWPKNIPSQVYLIHFLHFILLVVAFVLRFGDKLEEILLYLHSLVTPKTAGGRIAEESVRP